MDYDPSLMKTYAIAASLMILKLMSQGWITVYRMLKVKAGFRNPEDLKEGLCNPAPKQADQQIQPNEYVERSRRMHLNDLENIPAFLVAGLLFAFSGPSLLLAQVVLYGFVVARVFHFVAYYNAWAHEVRATFFSIGSLIIIFMALYCLGFAISIT